jgi:hypothetical protein
MWFFASGSKKFVVGATVAALAANALLNEKAAPTRDRTEAEKVIGLTIVVVLAAAFLLWFRYA